MSPIFQGLPYSFRVEEGGEGVYLGVAKVRKRKDVHRGREGEERREEEKGCT